jgi:hypothetical protein
VLCYPRAMVGTTLLSHQRAKQCVHQPPTTTSYSLWLRLSHFLLRHTDSWPRRLRPRSSPAYLLNSNDVGQCTTPGGLGIGPCIPASALSPPRITGFSRLAEVCVLPSVSHRDLYERQPSCTNCVPGHIRQRPDALRQCTHVSIFPGRSMRSTGLWLGSGRLYQGKASRIS